MLKLENDYFYELDQKLKLIPITYDYAFKKVFRGNLDILKDFLEAVIPLKLDDGCKIKIMDSELLKENKDEKKKIIDIYVILDNKIYVDIEMNRSKFENVLERNIKYKNKLSSMILKSGDDIKDLKNKILYQLNLNAHEKEDIENDILVLYGINSKKIYSKNEYMLVKGLVSYRKLYYNKGVRDKDVIWLTALTAKTFHELYELIRQILPEDMVKKFMEDVINMSKDEFVLHAWHKELFDDLVKYNEIESATNEGKAEGVAEGINKKANEIAQNMLKEKMDIGIISKITGLKIKKINELKNDM